MQYYELSNILLHTINGRISSVSITVRSLFNSISMCYMAIYTASATVSYSPVPHMQIVFNWIDHKNLAFTMN